MSFEESYKINKLLEDNNFEKIGYTRIPFKIHVMDKRNGFTDWVLDDIESVKNHILRIRKTLKAA